MQLELWGERFESINNPLNNDVLTRYSHVKTRAPKILTCTYRLVVWELGENLLDVTSGKGLVKVGITSL